MEYLILGAIVITFFSLSSQIQSLKRKADVPKKTYNNLNEFVGKKVKIFLDDDIDFELIGELVSFDKKWFELKEVKNNVQIHYKRIEKINSITIVD